MKSFKCSGEKMQDNSNINQIIQYISAINNFVDKTENSIDDLNSSVNTMRAEVQNVYERSLKQCHFLSRQRKESISLNAKKLLDKVSLLKTNLESLEDSLRGKDKYYQRFVDENSRYATSPEIENSVNALESHEQKLEWLEKEIVTLQNKYMVNERGVIANYLNYKFDKSRKEDYIRIIALRRCFDELFKEINEDIPLVAEEQIKLVDEKTRQELAGIEQQRVFQAQNVEETNKQEIERLSDEICDWLDASFPEEKIRELKLSLEDFHNYFGKPYYEEAFASSITIGTISFPVSDYVTSGIIKSLLLDKFSDIADDKGNIVFPLSFDLGKAFNLFISCREKDNAKMLEFAYSIMICFLSFTPATKLKIIVIDPDGKGKSINPFNGVNDKIKKEVGVEVFEEICTTADSINQRIHQLSAYVTDVIQHKLCGEYDNIIKYFQDGKGKKDTLYLLCYFGFPRCADSRNCETLIDIMSNGAACGVYSVFFNNSDHADAGYRFERTDLILEEIKKNCRVIEYADDNFIVNPYGLTLNTIDLTNIRKAIWPFTDQYIEIVKKLQELNASNFGLNYGGLFEGDSSSDIVIPIGRDNDGNEVNLIFGHGSSHHAIIIGGTGSGKSTLLHTLILSAMSKYDPDNLQLYLMDFKSGTEFKIYDRQDLPHVKLLAIDAMQEFGESIFSEIVDEMQNRRAQLFKNSGCTDIEDYIRKTGNRLPRILIIIDEFHVLFSGNGRVAQNCGALANKIVTLGRSYGIHLIMATQSSRVFSELSITEPTLTNMRIRIALKADENDLNYLFKEKSFESRDLIKGPIGTAVLSEDFMESDLVGMRVYYNNSEKKNTIFKSIADRCKDIKSHIQVFEGSRVPMLVDYLEEQKITKLDVYPAPVMIGSLIRVAPVFVHTVDRKRRQNVLIIGSNEEMINRIEGLYIVSPCLNERCLMYCVDGDILVGDSSLKSLYDVAEKCCHERFKLAETDADIVNMVGELYQKYLERKRGKGVDSQIFVYLFNIQWVQLIKKLFVGGKIDLSEYCAEEMEEGEEDHYEDNFSLVQSDMEKYYLEKLTMELEGISSGENIFDFVGSYSSSTEEPQIKSVRNTSEKKEDLDVMFSTLLENGYSYGINFVVSSVDYQTIREIAAQSFGPSMLTRFSNRYVFSVPSNDAMALIDGVDVTNLRDNTVVYTDGIKNTFQLKPFIVPSAEEFEKLIES